MGTFNALAYLQKHGEAPRTTVRSASGIKVTFAGLPKTFTTQGLKALAKAADGGRVSLPGAKVGEGKASGSDRLSGETMPGFLDGILHESASESVDTTAAAAA